MKRLEAALSLTIIALAVFLWAIQQYQRIQNRVYNQGHERNRTASGSLKSKVEAEQNAKPECDRNTPSRKGCPAIDRIPLPNNHIVRTNNLPRNK